MSKNADRFKNNNNNNPSSGVNERRRKVKADLDTRIINLENLKTIEPLTNKQEDFFHSFVSSNETQLLAYGSAGTGKSFLALYLALVDVLEKKQHKQIVILRSPLSVNHQGHLPGTLEEKEAVYERPYQDIVNWLFDHNEAYDELKKHQIIKFMSTSYIRGLTWDDTIIIADEVQNMLWEEINTIITRIGTNSRVMLLGDLKQDDIKVAKRNQITGMVRLINVCRSMSRFDLIEFGREDIVRSELVKSWIIACELVAD